MSEGNIYQENITVSTPVITDAIYKFQRLTKTIFFIFKQKVKFDAIMEENITDGLAIDATDWLSGDLPYNYKTNLFRFIVKYLFPFVFFLNLILKKKTFS